MIKDFLTIVFKNIFFVMSLSGTAVFIFYLLIDPISRQYISLKWRYRDVLIKLTALLVMGNYQKRMLRK